MNKYLKDDLILGDSLEIFLTNYTSQGGNLAGGSQGGYPGVAWGLAGESAQG